MLPTELVLVMLLVLVDLLFPAPPGPPHTRGRPLRYEERIILKAVVVMVVRRLPSGYALDCFLHQETTLVQRLRPLLSDVTGRLPCRRTWERRLAPLPQSLPGRIAYAGRQLVPLLCPWQADGQAKGQSLGRAAAIDSTPFQAQGGVWHAKDKKAGKVPSTAIDTEAGWSRSGWHGWWYGYKLHLVITVGALWIPLAARVTPGDVGDNTAAPVLLMELPEAVRYVLGDQSYNDHKLRDLLAVHEQELVTTRRHKRGQGYPHSDGGVGVRRVFHALRSQTIEPFNGCFKRTFGWPQLAPAKGLRRTQLLLLGAVLVYQLCLLLQWFYDQRPGQGVKGLLQAA